MGPVLVLGNAAKPAVAKAVREALPRLEKDFGVVACDLDGTQDLTGTEAEWAIVFGGDGAILNASRRMGAHPIPTLAVNFGRLGFLTEIEYRQLPDALDRVKEERIQYKKRMRLVATCGDWARFALNDVVVTARQSGRLFRVSARLQRREAVKYAGDGVVIATPTGSTAYSLAAGGPILDPRLEATVITPLCAHALSQRPLVVPADQRIDVVIQPGDPLGAVTIDGQERHPLEAKEVLQVQRAPEPFALIRVGMRSYYSRLRRILGWGGQPKYSD